MKQKRGLQISFAWLFAIIVGAIILFLAIYTSIQIIETEETALDAQTAKEISILLNPLETGFETGTSNSVIVPTETRIYNRCSNEGFFGRQIIKVSQQNFGEWTETDIDIGFENKYIFSGNFEEGKKFFLFSKPFEFPFKVADLIYLTSSEKKYCFIEPPESISDEISNLNQENLILENCLINSIRVCFNSGNNCDVEVSYNGKYLDKNNERMYFYSDSLMYAAVFSDKEVYECQLERIMQKAEQLSKLYVDKSNLIAGEGCSTNLIQDLNEISSLEGSFSDSVDLDGYMINLAENIESKNKVINCRLW
ncbi:hypothetical protein J4407_02925 [Candidatus Pacearchaeota archaeon]|nr:hypothetical protein [Candidatus Pacearchaeota archaeon]